MKVDLQFESVQECPVCKQTQIRPAFSKRHMDLQLFYSQCLNCKVVFLTPRMTDKCTVNYYDTIYRQATAGTPKAQELDREVQQTRSLIQHKFITDHVYSIENITHPARHLEIGSSAGYLLEKMGAELSIGVEPNDLYQNDEPAKRFDIRKSIGSVPPQIFDLISMSHSLEHINHPYDYLFSLIHNYTKPGSYILVEVPDVEHNYHDAMLLHHPVAYDKDSLVNLFARVGCEPVAVGYHGLGSPFKLYLIAVFKVQENEE